MSKDKVKITEKQFELFKKECLYWQDRFELHNWEIHFRYQEDNNVRAGINFSIVGYVATVFLSKEWNNYKIITDQDIKIVAKHEMIHLLIGRLGQIGETRFVIEDELKEAEEEIVRKLEYIIK